MNIAVFQQSDGKGCRGPGLEFRDADVFPVNENHPDFIGYFEIPFLGVQKPKKTVVKEVYSYGFELVQGTQTGRIQFFDIPVNAKNVKCTYEVEE